MNYEQNGPSRYGRGIGRVLGVGKNSEKILKQNLVLDFSALNR